VVRGLALAYATRSSSRLPGRFLRATSTNGCSASSATGVKSVIALYGGFLCRVWLSAWVAEVPSSSA
jgi:hypothetical protein